MYRRLPLDGGVAMIRETNGLDKRAEPICDPSHEKVSDVYRVHHNRGCYSRMYLYAGSAVDRSVCIKIGMQCL
jgi:hypothetical protein